MLNKLQFLLKLLHNKVVQVLKVCKMQIISYSTRTYSVARYIYFYRLKSILNKSLDIRRINNNNNKNNTKRIFLHTELVQVSLVSSCTGGYRGITRAFPVPVGILIVPYPFPVHECQTDQNYLEN